MSLSPKKYLQDSDYSFPHNPCAMPLNVAVRSAVRHRQLPIETRSPTGLDLAAFAGALRKELTRLSDLGLSPSPLREMVKMVK
jgi:hypothetical protein